MSARSNLTRRQQSGAVLFIALIVLVAMTLAGIAIMRSVDTGVTISGNLAFKQSTLGGADRGIDDAFQFLTTNVSTGVLNANSAPDGYFAQVTEPASWADDAVWADAKDLGTDGAGNTLRYVIHRMCDGAGAYAGLNCAQTPRTGGAAGNSQAILGNQFTSTPVVYYRVTVRVQGPRRQIMAGKDAPSTSIVQANIGIQH
jgi:type IV pilus assembly protein PilX